MARRKSDGSGGHTDDAKPELQTPETGLPPAGAESAPEPVGPSEADAGPAPDDAQPATVDTAAAEYRPAAEADAEPDPALSAEVSPIETPPAETPDETPPAETSSTWTEPEPTGDLTGSTPEYATGDWSEPAPDAAPEPTSDPTPAAAVEPVVDPVVEPAFETAPEPAPAAAERDLSHHDEEEEAGTSLAAWGLGILLLLLAGATLGIWAGPKIAPQLPSGMKPVADWLEPGMAEAETEIAALRSELEAISAKVGAVPSEADLDGRIGAAISPIESKLSEDIAALRQSLGQVDATETRQRLESLAAELQGQAAELATLKTDLTGAAGQVSGDVNVFKSDIEGVRAEVASLRDQVSAQAARLDEVAKSAEARVAAAEEQAAAVQEQATTALDAAEVNAQEALIRAAVASGAPYADAVSTLQGRGVTVPPDLAAGAASGIQTIGSLRDSFPDAAHAAIRASILAEANGGVLSRAEAFLRAQVASRSLTPQQGTGTDAVLSRMEDRLRRDDLAGALAESQALPSEAADAMGSWLAAAKLRLGATDGLAALSSSLPATN